MKALLKSFVLPFLSPGERSALRHLLSEFRISRHHRSGLRKVRRMSWSAPVRLNLGSDTHCKDGYLNVDMFPRGDLTLDLRRSLPFESNSCEQIFRSIDRALRLTRLGFSPASGMLAYLKPNGLLRFSVPDTEWPLPDYAKVFTPIIFRRAKRTRRGIPATVKLVLNTSIITSVNTTNTVSPMMRKRQENFWKPSDFKMSNAFRSIGVSSWHGSPRYPDFVLKAFLPPEPSLRPYPKPKPN